MFSARVARGNCGFGKHERIPKAATLRVNNKKKGNVIKREISDGYEELKRARADNQLIIQSSFVGS
jgi:hypothetical protein